MRLLFRKKKIWKYIHNSKNTLFLISKTKGKICFPYEYCSGMKYVGFYTCHKFIKVMKKKNKSNIGGY